MNKICTFLQIINFVTVAVLLYFTLTDLYTWESETAWLNPTYHFYTIRSDVKVLTTICIILPFALLCLKKWPYIIQAIVILAVSNNYCNDFFQKTIFINQPSSIQKTNHKIKDLIDRSESGLQLIVREVNSRHTDSVALNVLNTYTENEDFKIYQISIKNKKVEFLKICPKISVHQNHSYGIAYYPDGYPLKNSVHDDIYPFGTKLCLTGSRNYFYQRKWLIHISGLAEG